MNFKNKKYAIIIIFAVVIIVACVWYVSVLPLSSVPEKAETQTPKNIRVIGLGNKIISAEVAANEAQQILGLSNRTSLDSDKGMFFDFGRSAKWNIWMKDMNFPIDVLWITDDFKISDIVENMKPESYPKSYGPHQSVRYVLEVSAGTVKESGVKVGDQIALLKF